MEPSRLSTFFSLIFATFFASGCLPILSTEGIRLRADSSTIVTPSGAFDGFLLRSKITSNGMEASDLELADADVSCLFFQFYWRDLEPNAEGAYQFDLVDKALNKALSLGKPVKISVVTGEYSPTWLSGAGVTMLNFTGFRKFGASDKFYDSKVPIYWQERYLQIWKNFVTALSLHLHARNDYGNIAVVEITGINENTPELRIPSQPSITKNGQTTTNAPTIWRDNGFTPSKISYAWKEIVKLFREQFPEKYLSMVVLPGNGFPFITEQGTIFTPSKGMDLSYSLIDIAASIAGKALIVKQDSLKGTSEIISLLEYAKSLDLSIAYQLNEGNFGQSTCNGKPTECTPDSLRSAIQYGYSVNARWIEIFPLTIANYFSAAEFEF